MSSLFSIFAVLPVLLGGLFYYAHHRTYGNLDISTSSVAYDRSRYHNLLDWDKYALNIEGVPTQIHSGEFHYWRVPDRERWESILKQYRSAGFNTIRIYFHWGYHSPAEGVYNFEGNRDIEYLLNLCEKLGLFVLAAPGPYICAETQAGGYPSWLVAKRNLKIRHNFVMLWRVYDPEFAKYEVEWLNHILPIIKRHQITENGDLQQLAANNNRKGCVLALQIDNELFESMANLLPIGLHDQMRILSKAARDIGITVPLFTNDGFEEHSWIARPELDKVNKKKFWSKDKFGLDLYGFDKYVIFAPTSSPKSWLINSGVSVGTWDEWNPKNMEKSMDKLEKTVRGFGGGAAKSPLFIPELQGGWFNHYQLQHTYDQIYDYYGDEYTKLLLETALAQGLTMTSIYMIYGGTNWGTLGDPDVYTSYDYSACIREFGMLSYRGRNIRKTILLTRSFDPYFTKTERVEHPNVKTSIPHTMNLQRQSIAEDQNVTFTFFRNFDRKKRDTFNVTVQMEEDTITMGCYLPYKSSFIAIGNYTTLNNVHLIISTIPILTRMVHKATNEEVWIVEPNTIGSMAFSNKEVKLSGNMHVDSLTTDGQAIILNFKTDHGWTKIETVDGSLFIIGLNKQDASTLFAEFEEPYWNNNVKKYPSVIAWGADNFYYDRELRKLEINHRPSEKTVHVLSLDDVDRNNARSISYDLPFIRTVDFDSKPVGPISIKSTLWEQRSVDFENLPWQELKSINGTKSITFDAIDYLYTSGHVLYSTSFQTPNKEHPYVSLSLNARNRATVILNGHVVGGHTTYSRQLFMPGAKIGPDPYFLGSHKYNLSPYLLRSGTLQNKLVVLVESFGLCRQAFIMNDIRNPRGMISAKLHGLISNESAEWKIAGVDVQTLSNPFNSVGFPDENQAEGWRKYSDVQRNDAGNWCIPISISDGVQWFRFTFDNAYKKKSSAFSIPLRLHMEGDWTAMVYVNGMLIARYYGNGDGPQHDFYLPEDLIREKNNEVKILAYTWKDTEGQLSIVGWPVLQDSGNLITHVTDERPDEYMVYKERINL
ncbi:glycoside hydrolase superfamily [Mycotypha africana]|uniref:glycoside hydrolase superfamily n=1 Tax=Mycotypha africana TaxID=64632 RepID=UPI002300FB3D|nr:glycoside hydrolase superfamily [Mycotypha africana]KAI8984274.1 glycoside hydrolase superfamily [Mycotypha africana]